MTEGQKLALEQLKEIEKSHDTALEILDIVFPSEQSEDLAIEMSLYCGDFEFKSEGLKLRDRETFTILIPENFPFSNPSVSISHSRFIGTDHTSLMGILCLYLAPDSEWIPGDAIYGFLSRLHEWLSRAAKGELTPIGEPIHPPTDYSTYDRIVVVRANTPTTLESGWIGYADLKIISDFRVEIVGWNEISGGRQTGEKAAVFLLSRRYPLQEFPQITEDLIDFLIRAGIKREFIYTVLQKIDTKDQAYIVIGVPNRGLEGRPLRQHLVVWRLEKGLRLTHGQDRIFTKDRNRRVIAIKKMNAFFQEIEPEKIGWCKVLEDREEIVIRRDYNSPISWFQNRAIMILGCGALGSGSAEMLVRAGVTKLHLIDKGYISPGILSRQQFEDDDIGKKKSEQLANRLLRINPRLDVTDSTENILEHQGGTSLTFEDIDIIIDATASQAVAEKIESWYASNAIRSTPVASLGIGPTAERGLVVLSREEYSGGPTDVLRKTRLSIATGRDHSDYKQDFWPDPDVLQERLFQPEPGCSDATFIGSASDVAVLVGSMLNLLGRDLASDNADIAHAHFISQPHITTNATHPLDFSWQTDRCFKDQKSGYEVRISPLAWKNMSRWISSSAKHRGPRVETGGLLFGARADVSKVFWVDDVIGPPPDSHATTNGFTCGTIGTHERNKEFKSQSDGAIKFIGSWHTHPGGEPLPSAIDRNGMANLVGEIGDGLSKALLIILGGNSDQHEIGVHVFERNEFSRLELGLKSTPGTVYQLIWHAKKVNYDLRRLLFGWFSKLSKHLRKGE